MTSQLSKELRFATRALIRDNSLCRHQVRRLRRNESLDRAQLERMQAALLHRTLHAAIARLPYYSGIWRDFSVDEAPAVLRSAFPVIDKQTLLANPDTLYPHHGEKKPWETAGKTSGTTGTPLTIFRSVESLLLEHAFVKRHWTWAGFEDGMPRASLRGDMVADLERKEPPFWFWNRYNHQLLVSSRHLTDACADAIIDRLEILMPAMLQTYPSTALALATQLAQRGRRLRIPTVFTASEPLYPHQRELVLERLGCRIMDMYGMAERVAFATQCEHGEMHINPDYSYVEILDEQDRPTDGEGFVVGTTFHNQAMPLVRYRLSDRTRWKPGRCACGRAWPMIEPVTGKFEDSITGSAGQPVSPSVLTFAFKGVEHIRKSQVAQVGPGRWEIRLVPFPGFSPDDARKLVDNIHALVDAHVDARVVFKDALPDTAAGKFRWVLNEISREDPSP
jgi:phenylacetate-CoA ligase